MAFRSHEARICLIAAALFTFESFELPRTATAQVERPPVTWSRYAADPHWVQGRVVIPAPPDVVFERLQHVEAWPQMFTDIAKMRVTEHHDNHWKIDLETKTLDHGTLPYDVAIAPGRQLTFSTNSGGVHVVGATFIREGPTASQADVVYELYINLSGVPALALPDRVLRPKQEHMVVVQLEDLYRAFTP
jgi:hypothetical protein